MVRLCFDEDVHKKIALALRLRGYDVISVHEVKNQGIPDYTQLEYAVSEQRAIFTFNIGDFQRLHKGYIESGKEHFGKTDTFRRNPEPSDKVFVRSHGQQTEK